MGALGVRQAACHARARSRRQVEERYGPEPPPHTPLMSRLSTPGADAGKWENPGLGASLGFSGCQLRGSEQLTSLFPQIWRGWWW